MNAPPLDETALLVALVLAPTTYSRNRFFALYSDAGMHRVRRRAQQLRALVRDLAALPPPSRAALLELPCSPSGETWLRYERAEVGLRRAVRVDALELSVVRFALGLARAPGSPSEIDSISVDTSRVEEALARLASFEVDASSSPLVQQGAGCAPIEQAERS